MLVAVWRGHLGALTSGRPVPSSLLAHIHESGRSGEGGGDIRTPKPSCGISCPLLSLTLVSIESGILAGPLWFGFVEGEVEGEARVEVFAWFSSSESRRGRWLINPAKTVMTRSGVAFDVSFPISRARGSSLAGLLPAENRSAGCLAPFHMALAIWSDHEPRKAPRFKLQRPPAGKRLFAALDVVAAVCCGGPGCSLDAEMTCHGGMAGHLRPRGHLSPRGISNGTGTGPTIVATALPRHLQDSP